MGEKDDDEGGVALLPCTCGTGDAVAVEEDGTQHHVRGIADGQPIMGPGRLLVRDGETWRWAGTVDATGKGPAKVTTGAYREGYDRIFGGKHPTGLA